MTTLLAPAADARPLASVAASLAANRGAIVQTDLSPTAGTVAVAHGRHTLLWNIGTSQIACRSMRVGDRTLMVSLPRTTCLMALAGTKFTGRNREVALPGTVRFQAASAAEAARDPGAALLAKDPYQAYLAAAAVAGETLAASLVGAAAPAAVPVRPGADEATDAAATDATDYAQPGSKSAQSASTFLEPLGPATSTALPARAWPNPEYAAPHRLYASVGPLAPPSDSAAPDDANDRFCTGSTAFVRVRCLRVGRVCRRQLLSSWDFLLCLVRLIIVAPAPVQGAGGQHDQGRDRSGIRGHLPVHAHQGGAHSFPAVLLFLHALTYANCTSLCVRRAAPRCARAGQRRLCHLELARRCACRRSGAGRWPRPVKGACASITSWRPCRNGHARAWLRSEGAPLRRAWLGGLHPSLLSRVARRVHRRMSYAVCLASARIGDGPAGVRPAAYAAASGVGALMHLATRPHSLWLPAAAAIAPTRTTAPRACNWLSFHRERGCGRMQCAWGRRTEGGVHASAREFVHRSFLMRGAAVARLPRSRGPPRKCSRLVRACTPLWHAFFCRRRARCVDRRHPFRYAAGSSGLCTV